MQDRIGQVGVKIGKVPHRCAWRAGQLRVDRRDGTQRVQRRSGRRPGDGQTEVAGRRRMADMRQQHRAFGPEPLHQRACGHAGLRRNLSEGQLRRAATVHDPHQRREHIRVLGLSQSWTHRA